MFVFVTKALLGKNTKKGEMHCMKILLQLMFAHFVDFKTKVLFDGFYSGQQKLCAMFWR